MHRQRRRTGRTVSFMRLAVSLAVLMHASVMLPDLAAAEQAPGSSSSDAPVTSSGPPSETPTAGNQSDNEEAATGMEGEHANDPASEPPSPGPVGEPRETDAASGVNSSTGSAGDAVSGAGCGPVFTIQTPNDRPHLWGATLGIKAAQGHFFGDRSSDTTVTLVNLAAPDEPTPLVDLTDTANWGQAHIRAVLPEAIGNPPYGIAVEVQGSKPCDPVRFSAASAVCPVYEVNSSVPEHAVPQWGDSLRLSALLGTTFGTFGVGSSVSLMQLNPPDGTLPVVLQDLTPPPERWTLTEILTDPLSTDPLGTPGSLGTPPLYGIRVQVPSSDCPPQTVTILRACPAYTVTSVAGHEPVWWGDEVALDVIGTAGFGSFDDEASVTLVRLVHLDPSDPTSPLVVGEEIDEITPASSQWTDTQLITHLPAQPAVSGPYGLVVQLSATTPPSCPPQPIAPIAFDCLQVPAWTDELLDLNVPLPVLDVDESVGSQEGSLEAVRTNATNPLGQLLDTNGAWVQHVFRLTDEAGTDQAVNIVPSEGTGNIGPDAAAMVSNAASFRIKPALAPEGSDASSYQAHLDVVVDVPGCGTLTVPDVGVGGLVQKTVPIPTMAMLYEDRNFEGNVMVFLPQETTVLTETSLTASRCDSSLRHWDDRTKEELACVRTPVANRLESTSNVLDAISEKLGSLANGVPVPLQAVNFLADRVVSDVQRAAVVNATGLMPHLDEAVIWDFPVLGTNFNNRVSSIALIGFNPPLAADTATSVTAFSSSDYFYDFSGGDLKCRFGNRAVKFGDIVAAEPIFGSSDAWPGIALPDKWITNSLEYMCLIGGGWGDYTVEDAISSIKLGAMDRLPDDVPPPS